MPPEQRLIAFDTSAAYCAAVLLSGEHILAERFEPMAKGQAERLMGMLEEVLETGGMTWGDLTGIGVGIGPGNFTGIRISVAAARGLSLALGIPAIGVSLLEAQAFGHKTPVLSLLDARRDQVYAQAFRHGDNTEPRLVPRDQLADQFDLKSLSIIDAGDGQAGAQVSPVPAIARIAASRLTQATEPPAPLYVRPADAKPSSMPPVHRIS